MNMINSQQPSEALSVPAYATEIAPDGGSDHDEANASDTRLSVFDRSHWFRNLRVRSKIHTIFGTFFGVCFAIALVLTLGMAEVFSRYQASTEVRNGVLAASELRGATGEFRYNTVRYILGQEDVALQRQQEAFSAASTHLAKVDQVVATHLPALNDRIETTRADLISYDATFEQLRAELGRGGQNAQSAAYAFELSEQGDALFDQASQFAVDLGQHSAEVERTGLEYFNTIIALAIGLSAIGTMVLIAGLNYLSGDFSKKLSAISSGMTRLANGDRNIAINDLQRKDEIGDMAQALGKFKRASRQLEQWARERAERAEEEIRVQQERQRERDEMESRKANLMADIAERFEQTVGEVVSHVSSASRELQSTASKMAETADHSSQRTTELSRDMIEATSGATAAAAASDEFALSISEISGQAASSSELARLATDATAQADTTISELASSADQVGEIVELISTIAQRTNLLALNASIEAARGGEAGRGFAVVASEVKELAMQTSRATEQIAEQIRSMQDTTGASVQALRSIAGQVRDLESTAVSIASAVDQQAVAGQDLARSIDLAARGTEKVADHVDDVRELSLSTGAAASQVLASANELDLQAATLNEQVDALLKQVRSG